MGLTAGTRLGQYEIVSLIGGGGMSVVYKAQDTRLKRLVALKLLPPDLTRDATAKQRFLQEAQAASALDHPNICTIHEINETPDGQLYLVMAYYEGETLKQKIEHGPMAIKDGLDIGVQIGQGLARAHESGIVHRDIKPANIMVTRRAEVKILDFGLAKLAGAEGMTQTGTTLGTVAYMSPEQTRGDQVDQRSDVWGLGVVLYEMVAGQLPFKGEGAFAIANAIVQSEPPQLTALRTGVPGELERIMNRALAKPVADRYQTVADLLSELEEIKRTLDSGATAVTAAETSVPSIAVLPFANMSADSEQEYFSDGLTEEIITDLSQIQGLRVISRPSARRLKGTEKDLRTVGRELGVRHILTGSVRKAGPSLRITAQLIDATTDAQVWAEKYRGTLDDVFEIQERLSRTIVDALKLKLTRAEERRLAERPIEDVRAYECYLRARHEMYRLTQEGLDRALQLLRNGLEIVGENALLYAALGTAYRIHIDAGIKPDERYLRYMEECANKVFQLDPGAAQGHFLQGLTRVTRGNMQEAVGEFKQALAGDPNNPEVLFWLALFYGVVGKGFAAEPLSARLLSVDPLTPRNQMIPAWCHLMDGQLSRAVEGGRRWYEGEPDNPVGQFMYASFLARNSRPDEAYPVFEQLAARVPHTMFGQLALFLRHALEGNKTKALQAVTPILTEAARWDPQYSWEMATGYALIQEREEALEWLEHATRRRGFISYPFLAQYDPLLKNIRQEQRFKDLMEEVRSQWERFEV